MLPTSCERLTVGLAFLLALLGSVSGSAQPISYTVQVAALSDQAAAESLRRTLREAGYPAYLVGVPSDAQTVYRLRVGAFADREAAQAYAAAMRGVGGTVPVPALAEGIPPDLIPLEPRFVARYSVAPDVERLEVVPWGEAAALRVQGYSENEPLIASYRVLVPELVDFPFAAWRAAPVAGVPAAVERVTNLPLFVAAEADALPEGNLTGEGEARLRRVAEALGLTPEQVRPYIFYEPGRGAPFLIVAERFEPPTRTGGRYPALGSPSVVPPPPAGPELVWFGQAAPATFPQGLGEPLFTLGSALEEGRVVPPRAGRFQGEGWETRRDGRFTALSTPSRTWRAVVGEPLWAGGRYLLVYAGEQLVLYEIVQPGR
jgi:hypothetical protein